MWNLTILKVEICLTKVEICFNGILRIGRFRTTFIFSDKITIIYPKLILTYTQLLVEGYQNMVKQTCTTVRGHQDHL